MHAKTRGSVSYSKRSTTIRNDGELGRLAQVATMPRSSFSSRFTALTGEAPIAYLTRWRMNFAASRLREEDITAARLASELGYQSEAAFNRAFTRIND